MNRLIAEAPGSFGPLQIELQTIIADLFSASSLTQDYVNENTLENDHREKLAQIRWICQASADKIRRLETEFGIWQTQALQQDQIRELIRSLKIQVQQLRDLNNSIR